MTPQLFIGETEGLMRYVWSAGRYDESTTFKIVSIEADRFIKAMAELGVVAVYYKPEKK